MSRNEHWAVTVELNGEHLITIESNSMVGKQYLSDDECEIIRQCAEHLLSFAGRGENLLEAAG